MKVSIKVEGFASIETTASAENAKKLVDFAIEILKDESAAFGDDEIKGNYSHSTYSGMLVVQCDHCGKEKAFSTKKPIGAYKCECGHVTELREMRKAVAICECGKMWNMKTNVQKDRFEFECLSCGTPIDLELNRRTNEYGNMR